MKTSKRTTRIFAWFVMLALVISLFAAVPPSVHAAAPSFLGAIGARDPNATPISTAAELADINYNLNGNFYLANDIDLSGFGNWTPIGDNTHPFMGKLDGQGHVIKNMRIETIAQAGTIVYAGLFGCVGGSEGEMKNIGIADAYISVYASTTLYVGGIAGEMGRNSTTSNCFFSGTIEAQSNGAPVFAGGLVGNGRLIAENCYSAGSITAYQSRAVASKSNTAIAGGLIARSGGNSSSSFINCHATSDVTAKTDFTSGAAAYAGGIVGSENSASDFYMMNCYNTGKIQAESQCDSDTAYACAGGLVGFLGQEATVDKCWNSGKVTVTTHSKRDATQAYAGGLYGVLSTNGYGGTSFSIANSHNTGNVSIEYFAPGRIECMGGGLVGSGSGDVILNASYNAGNVEVSFPGNTPLSMFNKGNSTPSVVAGGNIGSIGYSGRAFLTDCYNTGNASASSPYDTPAYAGGLVGYASVSSDAKVDIGTSYSAGVISAGCTDNNKTISEPMGDYTFIGGLLGYAKVNNYTFNDSYYLKPAKGQAVGDRYGDSGFNNVKALTQEQLKEQASFIGFDFQRVWKMPGSGGSPVLAVRSGPPEDPEDGALPPAGPETGPETEAPVAPNLDSASDWARDEIASAVGKGFVPEDIQDNYTDVITRAEFCRMAIGFVEYVTGHDINTFLAGRGLTLRMDAFGDTSDTDILAAYALGITTGTVAPTETASGVFDPNGSFDREMAATMLMRVGKVLGMDTVNVQPAGFVDMMTASSWAQDGINFCYANGIMNGTSTTPLRFSPKETYTREQSIMTFGRIG